MSSEQTLDSQDAPSEGQDGEARLTMEMLHTVHGEGSLSQRGLAARLNIALGLTNAYLKRCVRRGLVKARKIDQPDLGGPAVMREFGRFDRPVVVIGA